MKLPSEVVFKFCTGARAEVEDEWLHFKCGGLGWQGMMDNTEVMPRLYECKGNDVQSAGELGLNEGEWWPALGLQQKGNDSRVKGLCKDHIEKLEPVVYSGAMEIAVNQGHILHKLGSGVAFSEVILYSI